jgi:MFS family permease
VHAWLRSLNPNLPRPVQTLQLGGLVSAFGNGVVIPFVLIYLHNVRGIGLGIAGLIVATNGVVSLVAGPVSGPLVDRFGGRRILALALVVLALGYGGLALVHTPWHGFVAAAVMGVGNGFFWPAQSTLLAALASPTQRPATFAMQRVVMNLGIGLGALAGGVIATTDRPETFVAVFLIDALSFLAYLGILWLFVPGVVPRLEAVEQEHTAPGSYRDVVRHGAFMAVVGLNALFVFAGMSGFELLPVFAKNESGVSETSIGVIFFVNTVVIVLAQLPITKLAEGHRRMRALALLGLVWAACWVAVALVGGSSLDGSTAAVLFAVTMGAFGIGECIHGAVQAPLVADLAAPRLLGRYMALSALSWQVGFALGPAIGGFLLERSPGGTWLVWASICCVGAALALALERVIPLAARRTPVAQPV